MKLVLVDSDGFVVNVVLGDPLKFEAPEGQRAIPMPDNATCGIGWKWNEALDAFEEVN